VTIQAIETRYKGYRFRSRLEARWAVFLDSLKEEWDYEPEGFSLASGPYLPDFWLPRLYCWLEIKGQQPTKLERERCCELAWATNKPVALAWGLPFAAWPYKQDMYGGFTQWIADGLTVFCCDAGDSSAGFGEWDRSFWAIARDGRLCICSNSSSDRAFYTPDSWGEFPGMKTAAEIIVPVPERHIHAARGARFERGESGYQ
jgi:hypothetical protein